ncbi:MAG: TasA family protein [Methanocellales archaeon]|nr:TasA family protein [Methanocellales archaeon]
MDRRILAAVLVIGLVSSACVGAYAYFSDTESSTGNTLAAGTLDMKIRDNDEAWTDGVTATWTATDMKPGDEFSFDVPFVRLKSVGTIAADHLEITCDYSVIEEDPQTESDTDPYTNQTPDSMANQMVITRCEYYLDAIWNIDCLTGSYTGTPPTPSGYTANDWQINDMDGDGKITFYDLKNDPLDNLPPVDGWPDFELSVKFDENAGNDFQGDTFDLTMIFTLNQDSSQ